MNLKRAIGLCFAALLMGATACDDFVPRGALVKAQRENAELRAQLDQARAQKVSRWRIEMRPTMRADTYLLDGETGRVWRLARGSQDMFWLEMAKSDQPWAHTALQSKPDDEWVDISEPRPSSAYNGPINPNLPPLDQRVVDKTTAKINGIDVIWKGTGWAPIKRKPK